MQINPGARAPGQRRHIIGRLMGYITGEYRTRFLLVVLCILISAIANVAGSLFLGSLIDDYITPLLGASDPGFLRPGAGPGDDGAASSSPARCAPTRYNRKHDRGVPGRAEDHPGRPGSAICRPCPSSTLTPTPTAT